MGLCTRQRQRNTVGCLRVLIARRVPRVSQSISRSCETTGIRVVKLLPKVRDAESGAVPAPRSTHYLRRQLSHALPLSALMSHARRNSCVS